MRKITLPFLTLLFLQTFITPTIASDTDDEKRLTVKRKPLKPDSREYEACENYIRAVCRDDWRIDFYIKKLPLIYRELYVLLDLEKGEQAETPFWGKRANELPDVMSYLRSILEPKDPQRTVSQSSQKYFLNYLTWVDRIDTHELQVLTGFINYGGVFPSSAETDLSPNQRIFRCGREVTALVKQFDLFREKLEAVSISWGKEIIPILVNFVNKFRNFDETLDFLPDLVIKKEHVLFLTSRWSQFTGEYAYEGDQTLELLREANPRVLKATVRWSDDFFTPSMNTIWRRSIVHAFEESKRRRAKTDQEIVEFSGLARTIKEFYADFRSLHNDYTYNDNGKHPAFLLARMIECFAQYDPGFGRVIMKNAEGLFTMYTEIDHVIQRIEAIDASGMSNKEITEFVGALNKKVFEKHPKSNNPVAENMLRDFRDHIRHTEILKLEKSEGDSSESDPQLEPQEKKKQQN